MFLSILGIGKTLGLATLTTIGSSNIPASITSRCHCNTTSIPATADSIPADSETTNDYKTQISRRTDWLKSHGKFDNYRAIRELFTTQRISEIFPRWSQENPSLAELFADQQAQDLSVLYTINDIQQLRTRGIDVLKVYNELGTIESSILSSELIIVGEVVDADYNADLGDGYASTVKVKVTEILKGTPVADTIYIRETSGRTGDFDRTLAGDLVSRVDVHFEVPPAGTQLLLHVSRHLYPLRVLSAGYVPASDRNVYYIKQRVPFRVEGDSLIPPPDGHLVGNNPTRLSQVREYSKKYDI